VLEAMSGGWGAAWRFLGANQPASPDRIDGAKICAQFSNFKNKPSYIILNLSDPADGTYWTSNHSVLDKLGITPKFDQLMHAVKGIRDCGMKAFVYVASEGPAKLKHGCKGND